MNFVTSYCRIKNRSVVVNDKTIFSGTGSVQAFATTLYDDLKTDYPKFYKMDNLSKLGFLAAELVLKDRRIIETYSAAVVLSNSAGSLDTDKYYTAASAQLPSPAL